MIDIIGAAFDLCGMWPGSRLGPAAIRLANIEQELVSLGYEVRDRGDIQGGEPYSHPQGLRNFPPLLDCVGRLRTKTLESYKENRMPLVLGGEHTLAVGCVSAALEHFKEDLAVLWIDAHADINTPGSSTSGNIHGMPLAALTGLPGEVEGTKAQEWEQLLDTLGTYRLDPQKIGWYAIRDVDLAERPRILGYSATIHEIDRYGVEQTVDQFDQWLKGTGAKNLWVSFDVDALDPILAPGTGTAVRGGLTYRECHLLAELLWEKFQHPDCPYRLAGVDIVETNPLRDTNNSTAKIAVEWIASLMGKTILGKR